MSNYLKVEIEFSMGMLNKIEGDFQISASTTENDIDKLKKFFAYAFKEEHRRLIVTISIAKDAWTVLCEGSTRFIFEDYDHSFEIRPYNELSRSYEKFEDSSHIKLESDKIAKNEMKKRILRMVKTMSQDL